MYYEDEQVRLYNGDCREVLARLDENSLDSCVTDPPYELVGTSKDKRDPRRASPSEKQRKKIGGFMNLAWDATGVAYDVAMWKEVYRVLKPGGFLLSFGGSRTYHRMACAIEDAGFEIRDSIHYTYGSGFPKSLNVTKVAKESGLYCNCDVPDVACSNEDKRLRNGARSQRCTEVGEHLLRSLPDSDLSPSVNSETKQSETVQYCLSQSDIQERRQARPESETTRCEESSMEGRGDVFQEAWQLQADQVCTESSRVPADGSQRWLRDGASLDSGDGIKALPQSNRSSSSREPQPTTKPLLEFDSLPDQSSAQTCGRCGKAKVVEGLGSAIKPAHEIICLARKPLSEKSIVENIARWSTGALNVDACRIGTNHWTKKDGQHSGSEGGHLQQIAKRQAGVTRESNQGRWPSNCIFSHSPLCERVGERRVRPSNGSGRAVNRNKEQGAHSGNTIYGERNTVTEDGGFVDASGYETVDAYSCVEGCPVRLVDEQSGHLVSNSGKPFKSKKVGQNTYGKYNSHEYEGFYGDSGGASRFFHIAEWSDEDLIPFIYCAKASRSERDKGLEVLDGMEIVLIELHYPENKEGAAWENAALQVKLRVDTVRSRPEVIAESTIRSEDATRWSTLLFGNSKTGQSLLASKSITLIKTNLITESKTLNWLTRSLTSASIADANCEMASGGSHAESAESLSPSLSFINGQAVCLPGVGTVASGTLWRISASANNHQGIYAQGSGLSGRSQINGEWVNTNNPRTPPRNSHPTVKPLSLYRYLIRLVTPKGGTTLDPFCGSGTSLRAAELEGFKIVAVEQDESNCQIAAGRVRGNIPPLFRDMTQEQLLETKPER